MISKSHFIGEHIAHVEQYYSFAKELGKGSYGQVARVQNLTTGRLYACKKMNKRQIKNKSRFKTEIDLLKATDHPNIIKLYDIFEDTVYIYLIMEECTGGEFFERLAKKAKKKTMYTEKDAAMIFRQILEAINYLHAHGVCHRDLKPENLLFATVDDNSSLKLIDFGLSKIFGSEDSKMKGAVGTTFYMAPEVMNGVYNEKCDVWACGVILYIMLCGKPPFYSQDENDLKQKIKTMVYNFDYPEFKKISQDAKDIISSILVDQDKRPSAAQLLETNWIKEYAPHATGESLLIDWDHIKKYSQLNLVQKSIINFTAFHLTEKETKEFVEIFKNLDENSDGVLTIDEIAKGVEKGSFGGKIKSDDVVKMFNEIDVDKNGLVNYTEFLSALMDYEKYIKKEHLLECFRNYDADGSGKISFEEFIEMIKPQDDKEKAELRELYTKFDENGDGEIDFNEFMEGFMKI